MNKLPNGHGQAVARTNDDVASVSTSPLFQQIAALMVVAVAARRVIDGVGAFATDDSGSDDWADRMTENLKNLSKHLVAIDFAHGQEIVAGAAQACQLAAPDQDIVCSGFTVGMPQKSKNEKKLMFVAGGIAGANKKARIFLDKNGAEILIAELNKCLDILYPNRLIGMEKSKLIITK